MMIRARLRSHLEGLQNRFPDLLKDEAIQESVGTDYAFRLFVPKETWVISGSDACEPDLSVRFWNPIR